MQQNKCLQVSHSSSDMKIKIIITNEKKPGFIFKILEQACPISPAKHDDLIGHYQSIDHCIQSSKITE